MMPRGCENPIDDSEDAFDNPIQAYDILIAGFFQFYLYLFIFKLNANNFKNISKIKKKHCI